VASLSFSPDGRLLAVGGFNQRSMRLIEVATDKELSGVPHDAWLEVLAFSPTAGRWRWQRGASYG